MEKLIEVLKSRFSDISIEEDKDIRCGGLLCRFNEDTMVMAVFINTNYKWMIRYSPIESFDRWSIALGQDVLSEDIQSVIDWFSDDKNIIEMYEVSLQDLSEYCESQKQIETISGHMNVHTNHKSQDSSDSSENPNSWILVSQRLPKVADVYRVTRYFPNNVMNPRYLVDACFFDGSDTWYNDNRINHERAYVDNIVAWQENPEPYEPQEKENKE